MFITFGEKLKDIENFYESKEYNNVVVETAKLMEQALGYLFKNFHRTLDTPKERLKFLEFERENDEKYSAFLKKPTIGVALGFYNSLLKYFPDHKWLSANLKSAINKVNVVRNAQVHAGKAEVTDSEAGEVIDAAEMFLKGTEIYELPVEDVGFPLKHYLVFTSIQDKFEKGETEGDFKKIISDASKLIPDLLNSVFNKVYPFLPIEDKEKLNQLHPKTMGAKSKEISLKYFIEIFDEIKLFDQIENGDNLKRSLQAISEDGKEVYSRRETRHHVSILEIIFIFIHNKKLDHFLEFADVVKKKYLEGNKIDETDRIILTDRAKELEISKHVAETIEDTVVRTIEKELILFQTLHEEKTPKGKIEIDKEEKEATEKRGLHIKKSYLYPAIGVATLLIAIIIYLIWPKSEFTAYERAFFEGKMEIAMKKSKQKRSLSNVKAHYYYLQSTNIYHTYDFPEEVKREYQKILRENSESPEAHLYLGYIYLLGSYSSVRHKRDSIWILIDKAMKMGLKNDFIDLIKSEIYSQGDLPNLSVKEVKKLVSLYPDNPSVLEHAAQVYLYTLYDTLKAIELFDAAIAKYSDILDPYIRLSYISMAKRDFITAEKYLNKANKINSKNRHVINGFVSLYRNQGEFEKAGEFYHEAIDGFGKNDVGLYQSLARNYLLQDKISEGLVFVESALRKFPRDASLLRSQKNLKDADRWLIEQTSAQESKSLTTWLENFNEGLAMAKEENKPILAEFTRGESNFPYMRFHKNVCADSLIQEKLQSFISVRISSLSDLELFAKYDIDNPYFDLLIISGDGDKIESINDFNNSTDFGKSLDEGMDKYKRYVMGKSLNTESYTEVTNFPDGKIISLAKGFPVMVLVGSDDSEYSKKLAQETIKHPLFQAEFNNLVYFYCDQRQNSDFVKKWNINMIPSILFFDEYGDLIHRLYGYKQPETLAEIAQDVKKSNYNNEKYQAGINWIYYLDEAKTAALSERKNILIGRKEWLNNNSLLDDKRVMNTLQNNFICIDVDNSNYEELRNQFGYIYYSDLLITDPTANELFRSSGISYPDELLNWLDLEDKMQMVSILGAERYDEYINFSNLATELRNLGMYASAILILQDLIELWPDNSEIYLEIAYAYLQWFKPQRAIEYFQKAIDNEATITENIVNNIINAYLQIQEEEKLIKWFDKTISSAKDNRRILTNLYLGQMELFEILQEKEKALETAKIAVQNDPGNFKTHLRLGRLYYLADDISGAKRHLNIANDLGKNDPIAYFYLGLCAEKEGSIKKKEAFFKSSKTRDPYVANYLTRRNYWYRPNFYKYPGYIEIIEQGFRNAMAIDPESHLFKNNYAYFLSVEGIKLDEALRLVNQSLVDDPDNYLYLDTKAWIFYEQGKIDEAHELFLKVEDLSPEDDFEFNIESLYHMGKVKLALGDSIYAFSCFKEIMTFVEPDAFGMRIQEDVKQILDSNDP